METKAALELVNFIIHNMCPYEVGLSWRCPEPLSPQSDQVCQKCWEDAVQMNLDREVKVGGTE